MTTSRFHPSETVPELSWHVQGLLLKGVGLLAGPPGSAKSLLAQHICWATAYGVDVLGLPTQSGNVLYLNNDHPLQTHESWFQRFCLGANLQEEPPNSLVTAHHRWVHLEKQEEQIEVENLLKVVKPALVVIDRLSTSMSLSEDRSYHIEPLGILLHRWATEYNETVLVLHHVIKETPRLELSWLEASFGQRLRGSSAILGMADCAIELIPLVIQEERLQQFGVRPHPKRGVVMAPFRVNLLDGKGVQLQRVDGWASASLESIGRHVLSILRRHGPMTAKELDARLGSAYDIRDTRAALQFLLVEKQTVQFEPRGRGGTYVFRLRNSNERRPQAVSQDNDLLG